MTMCVCVCVCVCVSVCVCKREEESECVCVCVWREMRGKALSEVRVKDIHDDMCMCECE